uniref:CAZy families GT4 protein n=1 Tax=uncultured Lactobacillus sp. TaxID=153152 RepID=A0A060C5Z9_9LACO|nr:CAZy families GT4 protein [uncultured Lactobacillus sp.]
MTRVGYYSAMDVFTMPSLYEGAPFSPIEALASGLLCICSDRVPLKIATNKLIKIPLDQKNTWVNKLYSAFTAHDFNKSTPW